MGFRDKAAIAGYSLQSAADKFASVVADKEVKFNGPSSVGHKPEMIQQMKTIIGEENMAKMRILLDAIGADNPDMSDKMYDQIWQDFSKDPSQFSNDKIAEYWLGLDEQFPIDLDADASRMLEFVDEATGSLDRNQVRNANILKLGEGLQKGDVQSDGVKVIPMATISSKMQEFGAMFDASTPGAYIKAIGYKVVDTIKDKSNPEYQSFMERGMGEFGDIVAKVQEQGKEKLEDLKDGALDGSYESLFGLPGE